jgi:hypothetical protein
MSTLGTHPLRDRSREGARESVAERGLRRAAWPALILRGTLRTGVRYKRRAGTSSKD